jgi:hypothetical protein
MSTASNRNYRDRPLAKTLRLLATRARGLFRPETRALLRQNAIRGAIANLIETERMRLAFTITRRNDG